MPEPRRFVIPPQSGHAVRVARGDRVRITDLKGQQVADLFAFTTEGALDWLSTAQTRDISERLFPEVGGIFYSAQAVPMLIFVENGSPGPHDMLFPACDAGLYARAGLPGHPNCRDNLMSALRGEGSRCPSRRIRSTSSRIRCRNATAG